MLNLQRITVQFVDQEDRLRLTGEDDRGEIATMWLTQRLLGRLLPTFAGWIERRQGSQVAAASVLTFEQEAARAALEPQAPVLAPDRAGAWLILSIDISHTAEAIQLVFNGGEEQGRASLTLDAKAARQWLSILHEQSKSADWTLLQWPEWMHDRVGEQKPLAAWLN